MNANIAFNPQTVPVGTSVGNQSTGIPFDVGAYAGLGGTWLASASSTGRLDVHVNVSGEASFYALLNNYFGTPGADEYDITIKATDGTSVTYPSIGGIDTRDYNANVFTNTIANTTKPWFNNGIGQRLDEREFSLPTSFASETISDFVLTQKDFNDPALFSGLTFSTTPLNAAPEPMSIFLLGAGLALVAWLLRTRGRMPN